MAGIEQLRDYIRNIIDDKATIVQMYFLLKESDDNSFNIKKASLETTNTEPEINNLFIEALRKDIVDNNDLEERKLTEFDNIKGPLYKYDYDEYPEEMNVIKEFSIETAVDYGFFDYSKDSIRNLFGFLIYVGTMKKGVTLFKKHYPVLLLNRDSFLLMFKANKRIEKIQNADILKLNSDYQIIKMMDNVYIKDVKILENNLGFNELIKKDAENAIEMIKELGLIENVDELNDILENDGYKRKLARAMKTSPVLTKGISKERIIEFTKRTDKLKDIFKYSADGSAIKLSTQKSKKNFIKLLNDDFLKSELTNEYYDARSKDQM